jgi:hypothetical protein
MCARCAHPLAVCQAPRSGALGSFQLRPESALLQSARIAFGRCPRRRRGQRPCNTPRAQKKPRTMCVAFLRVQESEEVISSCRSSPWRRL